MLIGTKTRGGGRTQIKGFDTLHNTQITQGYQKRGVMETQDDMGRKDHAQAEGEVVEKRISTRKCQKCPPGKGYDGPQLKRHMENVHGEPKVRRVTKGEQYCCSGCNTYVSVKNRARHEISCSRKKSSKYNIIMP